MKMQSFRLIQSLTNETRDAGSVCAVFDVMKQCSLNALCLVNGEYVLQNISTHQRAERFNAPLGDVGTVVAVLNEGREQPLR